MDIYIYEYYNILNLEFDFNMNFRSKNSELIIKILFEF